MQKVSEPLHPDFQKILQQFIKRYGQELGKQYFYAWVNQLGLDDTKPYGHREKFQWAQSHFRFIKQDKRARYYEVEAAFPLSSMNRNVYTEFELERAARTLVGKPVNINHEGHTVKGVTIDDAEYEDGAVECLLKVLNEAGHGLGLNIQKMIEQGEIIHVSIEASCRRGFKSSPQGDVCLGLNFTGLALLTKDALPGIPLTRIMPVERIVESFKVTINGDKNMKKEEGKSEAAEAQWTTAYINDLPDSSFAVIEPAYKSGKTDNKACRHLPHKDGNGTIDLPHLRAALARMNQIVPVTDSISADALRAQAKRVLVPLAKKYLPGSQWAESTGKETTEKLATLEFQVSELKRKYQKSEEELELAQSHLEIKEKAYNNLQVSHGEHERYVDTLNAKLEQLKETHENLLKQHSDLTADLTKLRGKYEELTEEHEGLVGQSEHTSQLLAEEQKAHYEASSKKIQLTEDLTERNNEILDLKTQMQGLKVEVTQKTQEISTLKEQNNNLLERLNKAKRLGKIVVKV
jgi:hypothetical protein